MVNSCINVVLGACCCVLSCSSAGRTGPGGGAAVEQVRVKQEPGIDDSYSCPASTVKTERGKDAGRSACMVWLQTFFH